MDLVRSKCDPNIDSDEGIDVLVNYSFVTKHEKSIDNHPLVQLAMRNWLFQQKELNEGAKSAIDNLSSSLPFPTPEIKELWRPRLPHVVKALEFQHGLTYHPPTWHLLYMTSQAYYLLDNYEKAKEFHERARRLEGVDILNRPNAALNARYQGNFKRAEAEYREAIKQQGKTHPSTLTMNSLAFALKSEGKHQEAKAIYKQVLDLKKRKWGTNSKLNLSIVANMEKLAAMHQRQREYALAEELLREALGLKMRIFGREHPSTVVSCESLALVFERQTRHRDAEDMCRKTLELKKKVMGPSHPSTKRTEDNMALLATFK